MKWQTLLLILLLALTACSDNRPASDANSTGGVNQDNTTQTDTSQNNQAPAGINVDLGDVKFGMGADNDSGGIRAQIGNEVSFGMNANQSQGGIEAKVGDINFSLNGSENAGGISVDLGEGKKFSLGSPAQNEPNATLDSKKE